MIINYVVNYILDSSRKVSKSYVVKTAFIFETGETNIFRIDCIEF